MTDEEMLKLTDEQFEAHWDDKFAAISRVYSLRPGHTLTQEDFDAIQKFDEDYRENEQTALDALHTGYTQGLREGGSADIEQMQAKIDKQFCELGVEKAMRSLADDRAASWRDELHLALAQHRDDLRHPPERDSIIRRLEAIETRMAQIADDVQQDAPESDPNA